MDLSLLCRIVTPERQLFSGEVGFVALPASTGEIGIAPLHAPLVATLGQGEVRLMNVRRDVTERYAISGGYVEVKNDKVIILADRAVAVAEIEPAAVNAELADVQERIANAEKGDARLANYRDLESWYKTQLALNAK